MKPITKFALLSAFLQLAIALLGHYAAAVRNLSTTLGIILPLALGASFGATSATSYTQAAGGGGIAIGLVGSAVYEGAALLIGDKPWSFGGFRDVPSAMAGAFAAMVLFGLVRRRRLTPG